jgi:uncharacterized coiled-coil protein SlyX
MNELEMHLVDALAKWESRVASELAAQNQTIESLTKRLHESERQLQRLSGVYCELESLLQRLSGLVGR